MMSQGRDNIFKAKVLNARNFQEDKNLPELLIVKTHLSRSINGHELNRILSSNPTKCLAAECITASSETHMLK